MEKDILNLLGGLSTVQDMELFKRNIDDFVALLFDTKGDINSKLSECFPNEQIRSWLDVFHNRNFDLQEPSKLQKVVLKVKDTVEQLPRISIGIAYTIPQTVLKSISNWFVNNYNTKVLLDIQVKKEIIGGVVIMDKGSFHDYSLNKKLQDMADRGQFKLSSLLGE